MTFRERQPYVLIILRRSTRPRQIERLPSIPEKPIGRGRVLFHCTYFGGAFALRASFNSKRAGRCKWRSLTPGIEILFIGVLTREQYLEALPNPKPLKTKAI